MTQPRNGGGLARSAKRALDVVGAVVGLVTLAPLYVVIAATVLTESGRPVLYRATVRGLHGCEFRLHKFRTMVPEANEILRGRPALLIEYQSKLKIENDPRITPVGRFLRASSLDELPQLWNVLRGEMSLVGPRVVSDLELERYGAHRDRMLSVVPGITGLWQVNGRHSVSFERRVELDLEYIDRWSFWLDLRILLKTFPAVLSRRGAS